ncbi:MAG TPA: LamG-like jellyroll fold domain-containing protein [Kofleriaceae bacterium]
MRSLLVIVGILGAVSTAVAATSTRSVPSSFGGNGHNAAFDGRLFIVRTGPGWQAYVLRPEAMTRLDDGMPDASGPMWSAPLHILDGDPNGGVNALAICETAPDTTPFACDANNAPAAGGPFSCYDVWVLDADASRSVADGGQTFRRRRLVLRVADPGTAQAQPVAFSWGAIEPVTSTAGAMHGIELTTTRDGRLLVWNGSLNNGDQAGQLMYSVNANACAATGWSPPRSLSHMFNDPAVNTRYELAMRQLRAADGTPYADGAAVVGAYPWLFQDGAAVIFAAAAMPCRAVEDPPGCGPIRNATSVIGAPTKWGLSHIDGGINPSTTDTVRLFFSSPGDDTFSQLPVTHGTEVYPFFGSNTSNYVEVSFDDALEGNYLGFWHMNESVTQDGRIDVTQSPDASGNFHTATVHGAITFPGPNNGVVGKAAVANNGWLEVAHDPGLEPTDFITMEMRLQPAADPDCDADNNFRFLLRKGTAYSMVLEETRAVHARVLVAGGVEREVTSGEVIPADGATWTTVAAQYDASSGVMEVFFNGVVVAHDQFDPAPLLGTGESLKIGGIGPRPTCGPDGLNFNGVIDEVAVSRVRRYASGCQAGGSAGGPACLALVLLPLLRRRRAARRIDPTQERVPHR